MYAMTSSVSVSSMRRNCAPDSSLSSAATSHVSSTPSASARAASVSFESAPSTRA